ncbi:MAG: XRE family transcriptional regulator [Trichlorobacter sp.]|jgi:DNA-binding XRE family transcriptional regulator|nr:XRE family transcriptional regulator [Trichlorobacter sp.]
MARTLEQILANEKPDIVAEARKKADEILINIHLAEIRSLMEKTQAEMAEALGVKQPTVAGMEKPGNDMKLSSLKRYVEAAGGRIRLDIELPDGKHHGFML